jgi:uncharacterized sporulation protein YeaH/YhbH (DUF444 family)
MSIRQDHSRFRDIIKGRIKENFKRYITHGEMIGKRDNEFVKIPIPHIDIPRFKYGSKQRGGVGQGQGQSGDPLDGEGEAGAGEAGNTPGEHMLEVEVSFEELAAILGEQLELPKIQPKGNKNLETTHIKYTGLAPVGPESLRNFKASYKEALKRSIASGTYDPNVPVIVPIRKDLRYRTFKPIKKPQANAVVIYMMDVSGSLCDEQMEIDRLESFLITT